MAVGKAVPAIFHNVNERPCKLHNGIVSVETVRTAKRKDGSNPYIPIANYGLNSNSIVPG